MFRKVLLTAVLISGISASAEESISPATPHPTAQEMVESTDPTAGPSFFNPKTEDDVNALATLKEPDLDSGLGEE